MSSDNTRAAAEIRGVLNDFTRAFRNKDAAAAIAPLSEDEATFDLALTDLKQDGQSIAKQ